MAVGPVNNAGGLAVGAPAKKWPGILMVLFAAFGGILYGYDTGTIGGIQVMEDFKCTMGTNCALSTSQQALIVSILSAGTFFGALAGAYMADIVGRKKGIIVSTFVFDLGVALQTASTKLPLFVVGRVFAGLGVGLISTLVPMYQSECSPKWIRGAVVSCYQWFITIGLLLASVVANATQNRPNHSSYRIPIAVQFIWAFVLATGMLALPESPRWFIKRGRDEDAARSLGKLVGLPADDPAVQIELEDIRDNLRQEEEIGEASWLDCFKPGSNKILLRTMTGVWLQAWQQLTGINFIFYYGTAFFQNSGIKNSFLISVATNIVNVFMTLPGIYAVDRVGRRKLLLYGSVGMLICEYLIAIIGVTISVTNTAGQKALIALVCIYIAHFAATWGPIAWVVVGEIFPLNVRAKGIALSVASNWLWNWAISYATPFLVNVGPGDAGLQVKVFFIWGTTCLCGLVFVYFFVPETKGLSLEQVDILYQHTTPLKSAAFRNQIIANDVHVHDKDAIAKVTSIINQNSRAGGILGVRGKSADIERNEHEESVEKMETA